ncbi:MAG: SPOR domain-containing protein [Pseudomonadota bacterium]
METTLKQRLIGAAVIIALAVIFVPMILDGSGREQSVALNMEVPPEPTFTFDSDLSDPKQLDELPAIDRTEEPSTDNAAIATEETPTSNQIENPPPVVEKQASVDNKTPAKTVDATETHIKTNPVLSAWAVQVAAFGEKDKALALQEKLLASNFSAFTEQSGNAGKTIYRVKVGPELQRENADELRDKIEKEHGLKGSFVTKHP